MRWMRSRMENGFCARSDILHRLPMLGTYHLRRCVG